MLAASSLKGTFQFKICRTAPQWSPFELNERKVRDIPLTIPFHNNLCVYVRAFKFCCGLKLRRRSADQQWDTMTMADGDCAGSLCRLDKYCQRISSSLATRRFCCLKIQERCQQNTPAFLSSSPPRRGGILSISAKRLLNKNTFHYLSINSTSPFLSR